jgi:hypothetical protein
MTWPARWLSVIVAIAALLAAPALGRPGVTPAPKRYSVTVGSAPRVSRALEATLMPAPLGKSGGDAAPLYFQAMLVISALPQEEQRLLDELSRAEPARFEVGSAMRIVERVRSAFDLVELATRREQCDWATSLKERGVGVFVPEAAHVRLLGAALGAKARLEILTGERDDGLRTIAWGLALARHVSRGPTILQSVVALAIADRMADQIELYAQMDGAPSLYWALTELGERPVDVSHAIRSERFILDYEAASLNDIDAGRVAPAEAMRVMTPLLYPEPGPRMSGWRAVAEASAVYPAARADLLSRGVAKEQVDAWPVAYVSMRYHVHRYLQLRDDLFKWAELPRWQAWRGLEAAQAEVERAKSRGEGAALLEMMPDIAELTRSAAAVERRFAMLRTIEAIRLWMGENPGMAVTSLATISGTPLPIDPVTGGEFAYSMDSATGVLRGPAPGGSAAMRSEEMEYRVGFKAAARAK